MPFPILRRPARSVLLALAGLAVQASPSFAQTTRDTTPRTEQRQQGTRDQRNGNLMRLVDGIRSLIADLKLSDDQKSRVEGILLDTRDAIQKTLQDPNIEQRDKMTAVREAFQSAQTQIREQLNDEQKKPFDEGMEKLRADTTQGRGGMQLVTRLERALTSVELTDEQKPKVQTVLDETTQKLQVIRDEARNGGDPASIREKAQQLREEVVGKLGEILTADQRTKLREALNAERPGPREGRPRDGVGTPQVRNDSQRSGSENTNMPPGAGTAGVATSSNSITPTELNQKVAPFSLIGLGGKPLTNASLAGQPTVVIFGSYSSPTLRDRIGKLQELSEKLRNRAKFVLIYTAEMYPAGSDQPTRNQNEKISVPEHKTQEERAAAARTARDTLKIKLEIAPDTMESAVQKSIGVGPNGAAILSADGVLVFRQDWADPYAIERALGELK